MREWPMWPIKVGWVCVFLAAERLTIYYYRAVSIVQELATLFRCAFALGFVGKRHERQPRECVGEWCTGDQGLKLPSRS